MVDFCELVSAWLVFLLGFFLAIHHSIGGNVIISIKEVYDCLRVWSASVCDYMDSPEDKLHAILLSLVGSGTLCFVA